MTSYWFSSAKFDLLLPYVSYFVLPTQHLTTLIKNTLRYRKKAVVPRHSSTNLRMESQFVYSEQDFVTDVCWTNQSDQVMGPSPSNFDTILRAGWTDRVTRGLFRYHLGDLQTRILPGPHCYVAQLNIQRGIERRKPQEILSIRQPFSAKQFNFNKINPEETIFEMMNRAEQTNGSSCDPCRMVVIVNVSPLEFGHCLLVPEPSRCFPQVLTQFVIRKGIESVLLSADPGFRVGFNSLGAFASVNHLHLHGYYLNHQLQIESMPVKPLVPEKGFGRLADFPAGLLFYAESEDLEKIASAIYQVTDFLANVNCAHNLFMTRGRPPDDVSPRNAKESRKGVRVIIWPRRSCFGEKEESAFNVALCELSGHLPFKNKRDFDRITEQEVMDIIRRCLLPDEEFLRLERQLTALLRDT